MFSYDVLYDQPVGAEDDEPDEYDDIDTAAHVSTLYRYYEDIQQFPRISEAEEQQLATRVQAGDMSARNRLIEANLGLTHYLARYQYKRLSDNLGVYDINDFIQAANVALIQAASGFRPGMLHKQSGELVAFASYARRVISRAVERDCMPGASALSFSVKALAHFSKLTGATKAFIALYGRAPTHRELSDFTDIGIDELIMLQTYTSPAYSLHEPYGPEDDDAPNFDSEDDRPATVEETIPGSLSHPEEGADSRDLRDRMGAALGNLSVNRAKVLRHYYGFDTEETHTIKETAKEIGRSPARVQQILEQALHDLRQQPDVRLMGFDFNH